MNRVPLDLYGGLAGATLESPEFALPGGVVLRRMYAHLMAHFILAFERPEPGKHHPGPWKSAHAGLTFDVEVEVYVPGELDLGGWFDTPNTIWWTAALLRLRVSPQIRVPVFSAESLSGLKLVKGDARVRVMETSPNSLVADTAKPAQIQLSDLLWLESKWLSGGRLYREHSNFANAFMGFDQSIWASTHGLGLVQLWGAFELLFATSRYRKTAQLGSRISAYLEPPGEGREQLKQKVEDLYNSRSDAAHGDPLGQDEAFTASYELLKRVILKILDENYVLSIDDLERLSQPGAEHRVH
jgi:hypothetical protein